jgi:hypothetical protein
VAFLNRLGQILVLFVDQLVHDQAVRAFELLNGRGLGPWHTVVGPEVFLYILNGILLFFLIVDVPGTELRSRRLSLSTKLIRGSNSLEQPE